MASNPTEKDKEETNWLMSKVLTGVSYGLALHYAEIQKAWGSCGSDSLCKAEKLVLYFTSIFGISSPSILLSQVIKNVANKAWMKAKGKALIEKDSYLSQTAMSVVTYSFIEYWLSFWWDWVRYATECLKVNACENDDSLIWINNMKAGHCNKTEIEHVHVELDCVEGHCNEVYDDDVLSKIKDNSDWCVVFFNELPLLLSAVVMWVVYLICLSFVDDEITLAKQVSTNEESNTSKSSQEAKEENGKDKSGTTTDKGNEDKQGSEDGKEQTDDTNIPKEEKRNDEETDPEKDKTDPDKDKTDPDKDKTDPDKDKTDPDKDKTDSDEEDENETHDDKAGTSGDDGDRGRDTRSEKSGEQDGKSKKKSKSKSTKSKGSKGKNDAVKGPQANQQQVIVYCPFCKNSRTECIAKPLPVYCKKCGKSGTEPKISQPSTARSQTPVDSRDQGKGTGESGKTPNPPTSSCFKVAQLNGEIISKDDDKESCVEAIIAPDDSRCIYDEYEKIAEKHKLELLKLKCANCDLLTETQYEREKRIIKEAEEDFNK